MAHPAARVRPAPAHARAGRRFRDGQLAFLMLVPVIGGIFAIVTYPLVLAIIQSLTADTGEFIGVHNYVRALQNSLLYDALRATGIYALLVLPTEIVLGLGLALLVQRTVRSAVVKAVIYIVAMIPLVVPPVAVGVIARLFY